MVQTKFFQKSKDKKLHPDKWWLVDAKGQAVGHLATRIANVLRGKDKPTFTPNSDMGDFVVVINASQVCFSGQKRMQKVYYRHSRFFGSLKQTTAGQILESSHPEKVIYKAVRGMLPKNKLSRKILKKLKLYGGVDHPHQAQKPEALNLA